MFGSGFGFFLKVESEPGSTSAGSATVRQRMIEKVNKLVFIHNCSGHRDELQVGDIVFLLKKGVHI